MPNSRCCVFVAIVATTNHRIFARQHRYLYFFTFPNIKKQASIARPKAKSVSAFRLKPRPGALSLDPATSFRCTQQLNKKSTFGSHTKKLFSPVPCPLPLPLLSQLQIPSAAHGNTTAIKDYKLLSDFFEIPSRLCKRQTHWPLSAQQLQVCGMRYDWWWWWWWW